MSMNVQKIQAHLAENEALLIESPAKRFYFTGFQSSAGMIAITRMKSTFFIDFRYFEKAKETVHSCEVRLSSRPNEELAAFCRENKIERLYLETETISIARKNRLAEALSEIELSEDGKFEQIIEELRAIKTPNELAAIQRAQAITDKTFSYILPHIQIGKTEHEIMLEMEFYLRRLGSEGVSFDFIVVSGKNSSLPHGVPTDKKIESGDFITMDFGAVCDGYRSDMTRTVAVGAVSEEQRLVYNTVLEAQRKALAAIRPGIPCNEIDRIARDHIYQAGFEGCFGHGLGHSVGIEIHESPAFSPRCETIIQPGMVITVEPGIYLEGKFGVRIEDMIYVTEDGILNLTHSKKDLIIL